MTGIPCPNCGQAATVGSDPLTGASTVTGDHCRHRGFLPLIRPPRVETQMDRILKKIREYFEQDAARASTSLQVGAAVAAYQKNVNRALMQLVNEGILARDIFRGARTPGHTGHLKWVFRLATPLESELQIVQARSRADVA